jgi:hypothetical protein
VLDFHHGAMLLLAMNLVLFVNALVLLKEGNIVRTIFLS